ncbi:prepilin-type N-terminal cleavage/methylation domain-containing protein [Allopusillimonas ginsengisoli]|uniref:prepilin-type N-terminal cleavage/methylation domain-containing protein n=1 Tax=Allopusillimonas ginsengisoli TaxID=453575 RepID=UPI0010C16C82|nr:prepilin-type N-terminal cleavage/methylation domain-containing protein [Allopusillimonas ginsengisoli]
MCKQWRLYTQRGFALLELLVATLVATLLAVWGAGRLAEAAHESGAQAAAVWMMSVRDGVAGYLDRYGDALHAAIRYDALAEFGYADWAAPTLAELEADGLLSRGFPMLGPMGARQVTVGTVNAPGTSGRSTSNSSNGTGAYVRLFRNPGCAGASCSLHAVVYARHPMRVRGSLQVDGRGIAQWLMTTQGRGGWVNPARPHHLAGASFDWANPPWGGPALLPGTVALAVGTTSTGGAQNLRVRDARDPEFQGGVSVSGPVVASSDLRVGGYLHLQSVSAVSVSCASEGAIALRERGGLLICRDEQWQPLTGGAAGAFTMTQSLQCVRRFLGSPDRPDSFYVNPHTENCSCPPGTNAYYVSTSAYATGANRDEVIRRYICLG